MRSARAPLLLVLVLLAACSRDPAPAPAASAPAAVPAAPAQTPSQRVLASMDRFLAARSFHATMQLEGPQALRSELDFVAPDRYRLQMPVGTQIIVGNTLYMDMGGKQQTMPLPAGMLQQWRNPLRLDGAQAGLQVEDLGADRIDGQAAARYRVVHANTGEPGMQYWIAADGHPLRIRQQGQTQGQPYTVTIDYSRFDDPAIAITAPTP